MRLKLFERKVVEAGSTDRNESIFQFQSRVNAWLQKVRKHPHYRIVTQSVCMGSSDEFPTEIIVSVWYEKVPLKE